MKDGMHNVHPRFALESPLTAHHLEEQSAETEDVRAVIRWLPPHLFRGHLTDGAQQSPGDRAVRHGWRIARRFFQRCHFGQAEVEDLYVLVPRDENVLGLQIAM